MTEQLLDTWFSRFIRLRDSDEYGYIKCCTCGKRLFWKNADNGHYVKRGRKATRFDEKNCSSQCKHCNQQRHGEEQAHRIYIDNKYGEGTSDLLKHKGRFPFEMTKEEYIEKIENYKKIVQSNPLFNKH